MSSCSTPSTDRDSRALIMDPTSTQTPPTTPIPGVKTHYSDGKKDFVASVVDYESEYEKVNSSMQLLWERVMEQGSYKTNSAYESVAVLLLSWDKDLDDMNIKDEVDSLERVFTNHFKYKVYNKCISKIRNKSAQNQVNHHVADFIYEEDGQNNLLIVYYAGHGKPGSGHGHLELAGKSNPFEIQNTLETAVWNWAEAALQGTTADVLEILDCCYAGNLGGSRGFGTRSFECLAATSSSSGSLTRRPGKASFTSALMWALLQLSNEHGRFDTVELVNKIRHEAPDFPRHQVPLLIERNDTSSTWRHIMLTPFSRGESSNVTPSKAIRSLASANQESLCLKFIFETRPTPEQIEKLGKDLNIIMVNNHFHVSRIAWGGLHKYIFAQAASKFLTLRKRPKSSPSITPSESPDPSADPMASWPMHTSGTTHEELPFSKEMLRDAYHLGQKYESARLGIAYHLRMLLICVWVSIAFLGTSLPFKGRGLIFLSSIAIASWCTFLTLKESVYV